MLKSQLFKRNHQNVKSEKGPAKKVTSNGIPNRRKAIKFESCSLNMKRMRPWNRETYLFLLICSQRRRLRAFIKRLSLGSLSKKDLEIFHVKEQSVNY